MTVTCLSSPPPPGPPLPPCASLPGSPSRRARPRQEAMGHRKNPAVCLAPDATKNPCNSDDGEEGTGARASGSWEGQGRRGIVLKEDSHKESDYCSWGEKGSGDPRGLSRERKQFLSGSLRKGGLLGARKHFQETLSESGQQGPPSRLSPNCSHGSHQPPRARATPQGPLGHICPCGHKALRSFLLRQGPLDPPTRKTCFSCQLWGLRRTGVLGTPKASLPEGLQPHTAVCPVHSPPAPGIQPRDCHQL